MKKISLATLAVASALTLGGCAMDPARQAKLQEVRQTVPTCDGEKDCAAKWDAAQLWVAKNAGFKIQTVTGVLIQTFSPTSGDVQLGATIMKEPLGGGRFRLVARMGCANPFGCHPDPIDALLMFNREVAAAKP
jgi:hypothetical protein